MKPDPVIDEIRRVRHEISAECGHDPRRILEYFAPIQEREKHRLVNYSQRRMKPGQEIDSETESVPSTT